MTKRPWVWTVVVTVLLMFSHVDSACGEVNEPLPTGVPPKPDYISLYEKALAEADTTSKRNESRRKLINALISFADQTMPTASASARVQALARVEVLYEELEASTSDTQGQFKEYFDHAYFLANHGFGEPIPSSYYLRRPVPDYPRALELFEKASRSEDDRLRQQAKEEIAGILAPVLSIGKLHFGEGGLVFATAIRNIDLVVMKLECRDPQPHPIREWTVNYAGTLDHEVQIHYYRIASLPECASVVLSAEAQSGLSSVLQVSASDKQVWTGRQDEARDYPSRRIVESVFEISTHPATRAFPQHHSFERVCGLCHIPHHADEADHIP